MRRISEYKNKNGESYGWYIRFHKNRRCFKCKKFTKKDHYGSLHAALIEARKWREKQERTLEEYQKLKTTEEYKKWRSEMKIKLEYAVIVVSITKKAILVYDGASEETWLPLSEIKILEGEIEKGEEIVVEMEEWLAIEKGLE